MIKHIKHHDIDKSAWDQCIMASPNGLPYAFSWYLDIVSEDWDALVEDDYDTVMPLTWKSKAGIKYLYPPFFAQQLGVFSKMLITPALIDKFLSLLPSTYKFIELYINYMNKSTIESFLVRPRCNLVLDLIGGHEQIAKNYSENTKRNIRKAIGRNLQYSSNINSETAIQLFKDNRGKSLSKLGVQWYNMLQQLISASSIRGMMDCAGMHDEHNELIAACLILRYYNRSILFFSAVNEDGKKCGAMPLLIDKIIEEEAGKDIVFDFEGSNNADLARFYRGFGAIEVPYFYIYYNRLTWPICHLKKPKK